MPNNAALNTVQIVDQHNLITIHGVLFLYKTSGSIRTNNYVTILYKFQFKNISKPVKLW